MEDKEKKVKETEKYSITKKALLDGYFHVIDGKPLGISQGKMTIKSFQGKKTKVPEYGSVLEYVKETIEGESVPMEKSTGKTYFEDLSPIQVHQLVEAKVIILTDKQKASYHKWLKEVFYTKKK